ncbi:MAG TPA: ribosome maturation factor RimP [Actinomycetota bacterium]|nr:ribosome maturation factor RimP [Actinomycetota bacterium]
MSVTALPSHVQELADRVAAGHGVEVLELGLRGQGRGRVLSVILDAEEPVEADVVELVSKDLSRALDEADPVAGSYTLEVSTPGLSRPLHTRRDFRRQRGHEVAIVRGGGAAGVTGDEGADGAGERATTSIQGVVVDADDEAVVLEVDGGQVRVPLSEVVHGKVVLPW